MISTTAEPDTYFPPAVMSVQGRQVSELVFDYLAQVGVEMNTIGDTGFIPQLAREWRWSRDSLSISFEINPAARWHDGKPVRASDVRFTFAAYKDTAIGSPELDQIPNIDSVTAPDSVTAVFWFHKRNPQQFFDAASQMLILPEHVYAIHGKATRESVAAIKPVGSGRFRFAKDKAGEFVALVADSANYRGRPAVDRVQFVISPEYSPAATKFLAGEADVFEALRPEHVAEVAKNPNLRMILLPGMDYVFMQFNLRDQKRSAPHPIFGDRNVRRALTMALDRKSMVANVFDSLAQVAIGPTVRAFASTDTTLPQIPFDAAAARNLLDSLKWTPRPTDGIREKNGRALAFTILVPSSSRSRMRMAVLIQEQLRLIGAKVNIEQLDYPAFVARESAHSFDAVLGAWHLGASAGGLRQTWSAAAVKERNGTNYGSYENHVFDAYVDSAVAAMNPARSKTYFTKAYKVIIDDAPAVWLYEPETVIGIHRRIRTAPMRPDAWWLNLSDWSIDQSKRIERDNAGPAR